MLPSVARPSWRWKNPTDTYFSPENVGYLPQVCTWTLHFKQMGEAGLEDRCGRRKKDQIPRTELEKAQIEIEQLKHKLYLAEMENALLKKLDEIERRDASQK